MARVRRLVCGLRLLEALLWVRLRTGLVLAAEFFLDSSTSKRITDLYATWSGSTLRWAAHSSSSVSPIGRSRIR